MKVWTISFLDKEGVPQTLDLESEHRPSEEEAAQHLRPHLFPVTHELDLNDLEGRTEDPTVKTLKEQNAVQIISIIEAT
ncbi:hypothetical protein N5D61_03320 [Pseudomonas sp. GD03842]|uniref:hypothetical protein n=1 Tax=unclassified Pseudomonas TaxID=196821 RepID=UPI000D371833|nr:MULTISPECIES: hypothetical protein [unclassified Pseudomonas]MDH0745375.1 hypothetical protein [Pseudomonas sp. GD03842]RAU41567.1 hypothetical protein DBP26_022755 [Pseudomonas sp. RIT 409]RAU46848.1 hypothetical protein DBY65_025575 [Pseudomonas sp. RIT 412]